MNAKIIPPETLISDLKPARFLRVEDLLERWQVHSITVRINRIVLEETIPNKNEIDLKTRKPKVVEQPVLYFLTKTEQEFPRGYLMSAKTDINALITSTGATKVSEVQGKKIEILVSTYNGRPVLRINNRPIPENET